MPQKRMSHDKELQRAELIQVLAEAVMDGVVMRFYRDLHENMIDLADPNELEIAFDSMVLTDDAPIWKHFKSILALPVVIKLYRRLS